MILARVPEETGGPEWHVIRDKKKLLNRVRRIRGQIEAVEKALVKNRIAPSSCRRLPPVAAHPQPDGGGRRGTYPFSRRRSGQKSRVREVARGQELIDVVKTYLK